MEASQERQNGFTLRNFYLESLNQEETGKRDPEGGLGGEERWSCQKKTEKKKRPSWESKRRGGKSRAPGGAEERGKTHISGFCR